MSGSLLNPGGAQLGSAMQLIEAIFSCFYFHGNCNLFIIGTNRIRLLLEITECNNKPKNNDVGNFMGQFQAYRNWLSRG